MARIVENLMPLGYKWTPEGVQQKINEIFGDKVVLLDATTYKNVTTKCLFVHNVFGPKWAIPSNVMSGSLKFKINRIVSKYTPQDIQKLVQKRHEGRVSLKEETYIDTHTLCEFADIEYGDFSAIPKDVYSKKAVGHRERGYKQRKQNNIDKNGIACANATAKLSDGRWLHNVAKDSKRGMVSNVYSIYKEHGEEYLLNFLDNNDRSKSALEHLVATKLNIETFNKAFYAQQQTYLPDFKLSEKLFLNVDGLYWHSSAKKQHDYHFNLRENFEQKDCRILQFYEDEIKHKWIIVESIINNANGKLTKKIFARKCSIDNVSIKEAKEFFDTNHLMGHRSGSGYLGLYLEGKLVSCISYLKHKECLEICRFGSLVNTVVTGGFGRLIKKLEIIAKDNQSNYLMSFCDLRYGTGISYESVGFYKERITKGWCWTDGHNRFNRLKCIAKNGKTESENAKAKKWYKLYDAGQAKYIKEIEL